MTKKLAPKNNIDLGVIFESTLLGIFVFIGRYFNTLYLFTRSPGQFTGTLDMAGQIKAVKKFSIVRPLTFFTISLGLLIVANLTVIRARGNSAEIHNFESDEGFNSIFSFYLTALKSFDIQKIVMALSPWVLLTGLFSYLLVRSAQNRGFRFSFEKSIGLSSYFCGSTAYALIAPAPLLVFLYLSTELGSSAQSQLWLGVVMLAILVIVGLRYFHAYLSILGGELGISMKTSLLVWGGGLWRFVIAFIIIIELVGYFLTPLLTLAENKWRPLAEQGNAEAQYHLALAYDVGKGIRRNDKEAILWYRRSAEQGYAKAQYELALAYADGHGVHQNDKEAIKWYRKAAEQGHAKAQNNLGHAYNNGRGVSKDYKEAVGWFRRAAEQGNAKAQNNLGIAYADGRGVQRSDTEAVKWYRMAAEQGNELAQSNLGLSFYFGRGVSQNYVEAVKWFRKAAEQGDITAQTNLGVAYTKGQGVQQNQIHAYLLFQIAANRGDKEAIQFRDKLQSQLSSTELQAAQEQAAKWKPGTPLPVND